VTYANFFEVGRAALTLSPDQSRHVIFPCVVPLH